MRLRRPNVIRRRRLCLLAFTVGVVLFLLILLCSFEQLAAGQLRVF